MTHFDIPICNQSVTERMIYFFVCITTLGFSYARIIVDEKTEVSVFSKKETEILV